MISKRTVVRGHLYPTAIESLVQHFRDSSYGNDVTDSVSFAIGGAPLTVWIDHYEPTKRARDNGFDPEMPIGPENKAPARFTVCRLLSAAEIYTEAELYAAYDGRTPTVIDAVEERQLADGAAIFETDDPDALLAFLASLGGAQ